MYHSRYKRFIIIIRIYKFITIITSNGVRGSCHIEKPLAFVFLGIRMGLCDCPQATTKRCACVLLLG